VLELFLGIVREAILSLTFRDESQALDILYLKSELSLHTVLVMNPLSCLKGCSLDFFAFDFETGIYSSVLWLAISTSPTGSMSVQMIE